MGFVQPDPILAHWHQLLENFQTSPKAFYDRVEAHVDKRRIPRVRRSRAHWPEAGPLSSPREYLRLERLGCRFDVCAAPFGSGFFVSWWLVRALPTWYAILGWHVASAAILVVAFVVLQMAMGIPALIAGELGSKISPGAILGLLGLGFLPYLIATIVGPPILLLLTYHVCLRLGLASVPTIHAILVFGPLYVRFFNPITYYALDTAQMFREAAHNAVLEALGEITEAKGIRAFTDVQREPVVFDLAGT